MGSSPVKSASAVRKLVVVTGVVTVLLFGAPQVLAVEIVTYLTAGQAVGGPQVGPSVCLQKANHPHLSKHFGDMAGEVTAECRANVPHMYHEAQLWETRFWGWDRVGARGTFDDQWVRQGAAVGSDKCRNNNIRTTGTGHITDVDQKTYFAETESGHVQNPCKL